MSDVVVLGGGLVGTALAYELASMGADVSLVDAALPGTASDAGAGIISPETFIEPDETWSQFGVRGAHHLRTLVARVADDVGTGVGPETFAPCGSLVVALAEHEDPWFSEVSDRVTARSADIVEITSDEAQAMFPPLGRIWRGLYHPGAARLDGRRLRDAVRNAAERRGVRMVAMHAVGLERDGTRVTAVRGPHDSVPCGTLVLAGGAWSSTAAQWLGARLPVTPTKGQIVHVALPDGARPPHDSAHWPIVQPVLNFYLVPWPAGRVACGGTFEPDAGFDSRPTAGGVRDLLRECVAIAPGLADATLVEVRVGLRPTTPDDRPLLGPVPGTDNVHVCTGHGANGLLMGPYSAALVAAGVLGEIPGELAPYDPARSATL